MSSAANRSSYDPYEDGIPSRAAAAAALSASREAIATTSELDAC